MQQHVKYLIVEDEQPWSEAISTTIRRYFEEKQLHSSRIRGIAAYDGDQGNQQLLASKFDLVTLDINLGEGAGKSMISGLDLLGEIAACNRAYFVIIITGAVNDPTLERLYGKEAAALMRYGAMNEAVKRLPAERVRILHKPVAKTAQKGMKALELHLFSALDQYCAVSIERNILRPLPGHKTLWEVRFNGGSRLTIPRIKPYEMIRSALDQPNREMKVIQLVQAIAQSSGKQGAVLPVDATPAVTCLDAIDNEGMEYADLEKSGTPDHCPVDTDEGTMNLEVIIGALLYAQRQGKSLEETVKAFADTYGYEPLLRLPSTINKYLEDPKKATEQFGMDRVVFLLRALNVGLSVPLAVYREQYVKDLANRKANGQGAKVKGERGKLRVAIGKDTKELKLARQHWKRARAALRKYPALREFLEHIEESVERGLTAKGNIHYVPNYGSDFCPFWLTR